MPLPHPSFAAAGNHQAGSPERALTKPRTAGLLRRIAATSVVTALAVVTLNAGAASGRGGAVSQELTVTGASAAQAQTVNDDGPVGSSTAGSGSTGSGPGYGYLSSRIIGDAPRGFSVWVNPHAPHHSQIASAASAAVSRLRSYGLRVTWRGYGTPKAAEGVITLSEGQQGCAGSANRVANTFPYYLSLPNGDLYMDYSTIVVCPKLYQYPSWNWAATVAHELGHAMGLGHTNYVYGGTAQLMNAVNHSGVTTYKSGDVSGLRHLAANYSRVQAETAPIGKFENASSQGPSADYRNGAIVVQGWAILAYYPANGVTISVTDNGTVVSRTVTNVVRDDVNRTYGAPADSKHGFDVKIPWTPGNHEYCVTATSTVNSVSRISLGCARQSG